MLRCREILDPPGPLLFRQTLYRDERGLFAENYHERRYRKLGLDARFVQTNRSTSRPGVLRGLHFQNPQAQGKLVSVQRGAVFDVAVDIRVGSPTHGHWYGVRLSADNGLQLWIPPDFAHGFVTLGEEADVLYHCTAHYEPTAERTLRWNDPEIGIEWPVDDPIISPKDAAGRPLRALREGGFLPSYREPGPKGKEVCENPAPVVL